MRTYEPLFVMTPEGRMAAHTGPPAEHAGQVAFGQLGQGPLPGILALVAAVAGVVVLSALGRRTSGGT